jgi:hypothetical protein
MPNRTLEIDGHKATLDARPDRLDIRDLPYRPAVASLYLFIQTTKISRRCYQITSPPA